MPREITAKQLQDAVGLGHVPDEELLGILSGVMTLSRYEAGRRVSYFHPEQGHALDVVYDREGRITSCEPAPGLTPALLEALSAAANVVLAEDLGSEICRDPLFSTPEVKGFWRHGDDWQIVPAPPEAPRPDFLGGEHPFVLEYRVRQSSDVTLLTMRRRRRLWELHLLLSLLLRGSITREHAESQHHWVVVRDPDQGGFRTEYANEGYMVGGGFVARSDGFSDVARMSRMATFPEDEYYARRGSGADLSMDLPATLDEFFDLLESSDPLRRERLLRACYWFHTAYRAWHMSKSLSFIAAINAVEALLPDSESHSCSVCGQPHRYPGPSALFRDFIEKYAAAEGAKARAAMYTLRSTLVHGRGLHRLDVPRAWGALVPATEEHRDLHDVALAVARRSIRTWFRETSAGLEQPQ